MHADGILDVAGDLDDGRLHQYLGTRHVELANDVLEGVDRVRVGQQDQGVGAFVGTDQDVARSAAAGLFAALAAVVLHAFGNLAEGFREGLGVVVAQADHPGIGRARGRGVQRLRQLHQLGARLRRAEDDQAVGARVGDHLGARRALGLAAAHGVVEHLGGVHHPAVAQVDHAVVVAALLVELADHVFDSRDIGAAVADDQRVGRGHRGEVAILWDQRTDQRDEFRYRALLHLDHPRLQAIRRALAAAGLGLGLGVGHDARLVALGNHGEAVGAHHREEQLVDLAQRELGLGDHADLALDPRVDDEGLAGDFGNLVDEFADVGILEVDRPVRLLLVAGRDEGVPAAVFGVRRLDAEGQAEKDGGNVRTTGRGKQGAEQRLGHRVSRFP